jgi:hypothetical protein
MAGFQNLPLIMILSLAPVGQLSAMPILSPLAPSDGQSRHHPGAIDDVRLPGLLHLRSAAMASARPTCSRITGRRRPRDRLITSPQAQGQAAALPMILRRCARFVRRSRRNRFMSIGAAINTAPTIRKLIASSPMKGSTRPATRPTTSVSFPGRAIDVAEIAAGLDDVAHALLQLLRSREAAVALALPDQLAVDSDFEIAAGAGESATSPRLSVKGLQQFLRHPAGAQQPVALGAVEDCYTGFVFSHLGFLSLSGI